MAAEKNKLTQDKKDAIQQTSFSEEALLNILTDAEQDKNELEEQRLATLNILEDVYETQRELQNKYAELDAINELTQELGMSLELSTVMEHLTAAIRKLFPDLVVAYVIAPLEEARIANMIYIHSPFTIGNKYLQAVQESVTLHFANTPYCQSGKPMYKEWCEGKFHFKFMEGKKSSRNQDKPGSQVAVPIITANILSGMIHISSKEENAFDKKSSEIIYNIVKNATSTITHLKSLVASEQSRIKDLLESMANGVLMFDRSGSIVVANSVIKGIIQPKQESTILEDFLELVKKEGKIKQPTKEPELDMDLAILQALQKQQIKHIPEISLKNKIFEVVITPVRDWRNKVAGGAIILHDITHLKEIDRMKTEFVSLASHQLRTPLTAIDWNIEMLTSGELGDLNQEQQEMMDDIYASSRRMIILINDLLNVSRLETGRLKIEPKLIQLEDLISSIIKEAKPLAVSRKCKITLVKPKTKLKKIPLDSILIRQVIHNLITNAIRYSADEENTHLEKKAEVKVKFTKKKEREKEFIVIIVQDNGIGIPHDAQDRIFQKFFRADNAVKATTEGSGLGLYISKLIIEAVGGKIWFKSKLGQGTTFYVSIPTQGMKKKEGEKSLSLSIHI